MSRTKALSVLAGMVAMLAISVASASAQWEANGIGTTGKGRVTESGVFIGGSGAGKSEVKCPEEGIEASWSIQSSGQIKIHNSAGKQESVKKGPHLYINVMKWGPKCSAKIGGASPIQAHLKPCELQLVQATGNFVATGGVATECRIEAGPCTIIVPAGMETGAETNTGINVGLSETKLENVGKNQIDKVNTTGIRAEKQVNALCPLVTIQTAELKGLTFEVIEAKAV